MNNDSTGGPEYSDDFLRDSYRGLLKFLIYSVDEPDVPGRPERRHESHLRELVEAGRFDDAHRYIDAMIAFCERHEFRESWRYENYRNRVKQLAQ